MSSTSKLKKPTDGFAACRRIPSADSMPVAHEWFGAERGSGQRTWSGESGDAIVSQDFDHVADGDAPSRSDPAQCHSQRVAAGKAHACVARGVGDTEQRHTGQGARFAFTGTACTRSELSAILASAPQSTTASRTCQIDRWIIRYSVRLESFLQQQGSCLRTSTAQQWSAPPGCVP